MTQNLNITIYVQGKPFLMQRELLESKSGFFKALFSGKFGTQETNDSIHLDYETDVETFEYLMFFVKHGEIPASFERDVRKKDQFKLKAAYYDFILPESRKQYIYESYYFNERDPNSGYFSMKDINTDPAEIFLPDHQFSIYRIHYLTSLSFMWQNIIQDHCLKQVKKVYYSDHSHKISNEKLLFSIERSFEEMTVLYPGFEIFFKIKQ